MLPRSLLARSGHTGRRLPALPAVVLLRDASRAMLDTILDSNRPLRDRLSPLLLLAMLSTLPLVIVTTGTGPLFVTWLAMSYLLAGYLWIDLAVKRADRSHYWRGWVVAAGGLTAIALALPARAGTVATTVVAIAAIAVVVAGIRFHAPDRTVAWYVLIAALGVAVAGQLAAMVGLLRNDSVPVFANLISLAGIVPLPVVAWLLLHRRVPGSARTSLLDTAIVTSGLGLMAWVFLIAPRIADPAESRLEQIALLGWPIVALAILVVAIRFLLARGAAHCAARILAGASLFLLIAAIVASSWQGSGATDQLGYPGMGVVWLLALIGFGATALHPSMLQLAEPIHEQATEYDPQRGLLLTLALLMAPAALIAQHERGDALSVEVIAGGTVLLALLFAARAFGLQRTRTQTRASERYLRLAAADLVISDGRDAIIQVTIDAAHKIAGTRAATALYLAEGTTGEYMLQTETGTSTARVIRDRELPHAARRVLAAGTTAWLSAEEITSTRMALALDPETTVTAIAPVNSGPALRGLLVSAGNRLDHDTARSLETLAAMLSLALDRQQYADDSGFTPSRPAVRAQAADGTAFTFVDVDPTIDHIDQSSSVVTGESIAAALADALARDGLRDRYQPRFDLVTGRIASVEMTLAWESPHGGLIPHGALAAIAAEHALSQPYRQALLLRGCRQAVEFDARYPGRAVDVVIPLSAFELIAPGFTNDVEQALTTTDCNPTQIVLQCPAASLLESAAVIVPALGDLAAIGVQIAICEAGASWSELDRLDMVPVSTIELEPALVQQIDSDERSAAIANHLIARAHHLGARIAAHGIDQRQHWISLRKLHGDFGQGDLFSPPLDADTLASLLGRAQQREDAA